MTNIGTHIELYVQRFYPKLVSDDNSYDGIDEISYKIVFDFKLLLSKRIVFVKSIEINTNGRLIFSNLTWLFYSNDIIIKLVGYCSSMFSNSEFNHDISLWDVPSVTNMLFMFASSKFNQDISSWGVSRVEHMDSMFYNSKFNQDTSRWDVSSVTDMSFMFKNSEFNHGISSLGCIEC